MLVISEKFKEHNIKCRIIKMGNEDVYKRQVEDLISTGKSSIEAVEVLRELGCDVLGIVSIFSYELESGLKNLEAASCKNVSLCNYQTLVEVAAEVGEISEDSIAKLSAWRQNPADESWLTK